MDALTIFLIALGLSMDAFAVSVTSGFTIEGCRLRHAALIAFFFGAFQAAMPVAGWFAGISLKRFIVGIDHWVAFAILGFIGCKMIYESAFMGGQGKKCNALGLGTLLGLSVATSIDALAVGVTFAFLDVLILKPVLVIGAVTFALSYAGVIIGKRAGGFFEGRIEVAGGVVLVLIGLKILVEHLYFGG